jgi:hypothetical protein
MLPARCFNCEAESAALPDLTSGSLSVSLRINTVKYRGMMKGDLFVPVARYFCDRLKV